MYFDVEKFFDSVRHDVLVERALALGFPVRLLGLAMLVQSAPRVLRAGRYYSDAVVPEWSILTGLWHPKRRQISHRTITQLVGELRIRLKANRTSQNTVPRARQHPFTEDERTKFRQTLHKEMTNGPVTLVSSHRRSGEHCNG